MKSNIHPEYFEDTKVVCSCGHTYSFGSTRQTIHVELCANCHPFYTGAQRFIDSRSAIANFDEKRKKAAQFKVAVTKKKEEKAAKNVGPKSLAEMLSSFK